DDERSADVVGARPGELVILRRTAAGERDADVGKLLDDGAQGERRPHTCSEWIQRNPGAVAAPGEVQDVDQNRAVAGLVIVRLELRRGDRAADEILEREALEVERLGDERLVADRHELAPRLPHV